MPGHSDKKMGSGGMDIPAISREEQVMRDLPKGNVPTDMEELKRLNPTMDFRTFDEMEADKAQTLQSDMMMLQKLFEEGDPNMGREVKQMMDMVGAGFTVQEILELMQRLDPRSVVREGENLRAMRTGGPADAIINRIDPQSVIREGGVPMTQGTPMGMGDQMIRDRFGAGALGALNTARRDMGSAT